MFVVDSTTLSWRSFVTAVNQIYQNQLQPSSQTVDITGVKSILFIFGQGSFCSPCSQASSMRLHQLLLASLLWSSGQTAHGRANAKYSIELKFLNSPLFGFKFELLHQLKYTVSDSPSFCLLHVLLEYALCKSTGLFFSVLGETKHLLTDSVSFSDFIWRVMVIFSLKFPAWLL